MSSILGRNNSTFGGALSAESTSVNYSGVEGAGLMTQNLQISYQQQVQRVWEIDSAETFYIVGRSEGELTIGRIVGVRVLSAQFIDDFSDPCEVASNVMSIQTNAGCNSGEVVGELTLNYVLVRGFQLAIAANDMILNENLNAMFAGLDMRT